MNSITIKETNPVLTSIDDLIEKRDQQYDKNLDTLSWEETYKAMAKDKEDWSDFDVTIADGLDCYILSSNARIKVSK